MFFKGSLPFKGKDLFAKILKTLEQYAALLGHVDENPEVKIYNHVIHTF